MRARRIPLVKSESSIPSRILLWPKTPPHFTEGTQLAHPQPPHHGERHAGQLQSGGEQNFAGRGIFHFRCRNQHRKNEREYLIGILRNARKARPRSGNAAPRESCRRSKVTGEDNHGPAPPSHRAASHLVRAPFVSDPPAVPPVRAVSPRALRPMPANPFRQAARLPPLANCGFQCCSPSEVTCIRRKEIHASKNNGATHHAAPSGLGQPRTHRCHVLRLRTCLLTALARPRERVPGRQVPIQRAANS